MNLCPRCGGVGILKVAAGKSIYCPTCFEQWKGVVRPAPGPDRPIPYARHLIDDDDRAAVDDVLRSDRLTQGEKVPEFEEALCAYTGARYAVVVSSGTAALWCAWREISRRMDWVSLPAVTFAATANAACVAGIKVGVTGVTDIDAETWIGGIEGRVTLGGLPDSRVTYVTDAAHGPWTHGSVMTCLSFHPAKHITTGEGGAVLTDDPEIARTLRRLRDNGRETAAEMPQIVGLNLRMNEMSAALGISQLRKLDGWLARRRAIARAYREAFEPLGVKMQPDHPDHWYHLMILWLDPERWNRDIVRRNLTERGVGTTLWPGHGPLYRLPMYQQDPERFPNAERYWRGHLCIPMSHALTDGDVEHVITSVREVLA